MSNPLRKTMVYLGLADEELEYEDATAHTPAAQAPAAQPVRQSLGQRAEPRARDAAAQVIRCPATHRRQK